MRTALLKIWISSMLMLFMMASVAQESSYEPKPRAKKAFDEALFYWRSSDFVKAESGLHKAVEIDPAYPEPHILLGDLYFDQDKFDASINSYQKAIEIDSLHEPRLYYLIGRVYFEQEEYAETIGQLETFLSLPGIRKDLQGYAEEMLKISRFRQYALAHPVPFEPENLGANVNSEHDEYVNSITLDDNKLVYTLMQPDTMIEGFYMEGFVMAVKTDSGWVDAGRTLPALHDLGNIGAMSLSPDARFLFFTSCGAIGGIGSCDLYVCGKRGEGWSKPQNLGPMINTANWDSQPCFSADGKTLYFVSARRGTIGGSDVWYSTFVQDTGWTKPLNAGPEINTTEEEMAPFIHPDGKTMYFSSKGHTGMGGFDLFISRMDSSGKWGSPENLGYPINTSYNEINIVVATNGKAAYLSSRQDAGYGGYDIYRFDLPQVHAPMPVSYLEGHVYDADTKEALSAEILLIDLESGDVTVRCASDPGSGHYVAALPGGKNYALNISKTAYLFYSENFNMKLTDMPAESVEMDVYLQPVKAGYSFVLNNIFFETDKYNLNELSRVELLKLEDFLEKNPDIRIMICGHTDAVGSEDYNQNLSENRAGAVYSFLIEAGILPERLQFKGFGKSEPVSDNDTEEGRAENRRTEVLIL